MFLKRTKFNWILKWATLLGCLFVIGYIFFGDSLFLNTSRANFDNISIYVFLLSSICIAPIYEEITFRGILGTKKTPRILSLILIVPVTFAMGFGSYPFYIVSLFAVLACCIVLIATTKVNWDLEKKITFNVLATSLLFATMHYNFSDFKLYTIVFTLSLHLSLGLFFSWVMLNYGLLLSIGAHMLYNGIIAATVVFSLQFIDTAPKELVVDNVKMEWRQVPLLENTRSSVDWSESGVNANNTTLNSFFKYGVFTDSLNSSVFIKVPFAVYDINIKKGDGTKLDSKEVISCLLKAELLGIKK